MLDHMREHSDIFICPACKGSLEIAVDSIICLKCHNSYEVEDGIPLLFWPHEGDDSREHITKTVKAFYEKTPFPNYEENENIGNLVQKAQESFFPRLLNEQIPFNIRMLEVGCGTGQLSNFLGAAHRNVFGADLCLNSLKLGQKFKEKNDLKRVGFYQMNLFRPIFKEESFPLVICNGVLMTTTDPYGGFKSISKLVKDGGYIVIGLYNTYGRLITDIRRIIFRISGDHFKFLDPRLRGHDRGEAKKEAWFADQYKHPRELKHTMGELLKWFDETGFEFVYGVPNPKAFSTFKLNDTIFKKHPRGNWLDHFITQLHMVLTGSKEGGFFTMVGKKRK